MFPYVRDAADQAVTVENSWAERWREGFEGAAFDGGAALDMLPSGVSVVPFVWRMREESCSMEFVSGFAGVAQDGDTFAVQPAIGWAVREVAR